MLDFANTSSTIVQVTDVASCIIWRVCQFVHMSSGGVERNARIETEEDRKNCVMPIVQLKCAPSVKTTCPLGPGSCAMCARLHVCNDIERHEMGLPVSIARIQALSSRVSTIREVAMSPNVYKIPGRDIELRTWDPLDAFEQT